jgi:hypothetical protein
MMKVRAGLFSLEEEEMYTEVQDQVSMFVPDQSMSVRDIIQQFALTGQALPTDPIEEGSEDFDDAIDLRSLDIAELQELSEHARTILDDYQRARNDLAKPAAEKQKAEEPSADA